jgi:hypothetical protein
MIGSIHIILGIITFFMTLGIMDITHQVIGIRGIIGVHGIHGIMVLLGDTVPIQAIYHCILSSLPILIMDQATVMAVGEPQLP